MDEPKRTKARAHHGERGNSAVQDVEPGAASPGKPFGPMRRASQAAAATSDVRAADPAARRHALLFVVAATVVGVVFIAGIEHYRIWLRDWVLAEPGATALRIKVVFRLFAGLVVAPLLGLAAYLWSLGVKVLRAKEFPPPGYRVIRDTPVITGDAAVSRGRRIKTLALGCGIASAVLGILLWRLV